MKAIFTIAIVLGATIGNASELPYKVVNGGIVWKPIAKDVHKPAPTQPPVIK